MGRVAAVQVQARPDAEEGAQVVLRRPGGHPTGRETGQGAGVAVRASPVVVGNGCAVAVTVRRIPSATDLLKANTSVATLGMETRRARTENTGPVSSTALTGVHGPSPNPSAPCRGMDQGLSHDPARGCEEAFGAGGRGRVRRTLERVTIPSSAGDRARLPF